MVLFSSLPSNDMFDILFISQRMPFLPPQSSSPLTRAKASSSQDLTYSVRTLFPFPLIPRWVISSFWRILETASAHINCLKILHQSAHESGLLGCQKVGTSLIRFLAVNWGCEGFQSQFVDRTIYTDSLSAKWQMNIVGSCGPFPSSSNFTSHCLLFFGLSFP